MRRVYSYRLRYRSRPFNLHFYTRRTYVYTVRILYAITSADESPKTESGQTRRYLHPAPPAIAMDDVKYFRDLWIKTIIIFFFIVCKQIENSISTRARLIIRLVFCTNLFQTIIIALYAYLYYINSERATEVAE